VRKNVLISDQSGAAIPAGKGAVVTIRFRDQRKGVRVLDLTDEEAERLGGRHAKRRGARRAKQQTPVDA
jgi:hypothetical protein